MFDKREGFAGIVRGVCTQKANRPWDTKKDRYVDMETEWCLFNVKE